MRSRKKLDTLRVLTSGYSLVGSDAFFWPLSDPVLDDAVADAVSHIHSRMTLSIALSPRRFVCLDKEEPHWVTSCPMGFYEVADDWT